MSRIFIVEDDISIRNELVELLKNAGYQAGYAENFDNIAGSIAGYSPDLVLLDINLPGTKGEQLLKELQSGTYPHIPWMLC